MTTTSPPPARPTGRRVLAVGRLSVLWHPRTVLVCCALALVAFACGVVMMGNGTVALSPAEVLSGLFGLGDDPVAQKVVLGIRLPRLVTGVFVGACLGTAGCVFQSISRNALGSPDIIGFTTGSATGAIVQIVVFDAGPVATALGAVGGGLASAAVVYLLSVKGGVTGGYRLVLIGIGVGAVLQAANTLLLARGDLDSSVEAELWLNGSLNARTWSQAWPVLIGFLVLLPVVIACGRGLDRMELGDDGSRQLGVAVERTRLVAMAAAVGMTALATAAAGPIAFIALAAPQLVRRLTASTVVPLVSSAFMGAALVVAADLLVQHLPLSFAMPIGLMTGLLGGLYLLWLLTRSRQI